MARIILLELLVEKEHLFQKGPNRGDSRDSGMIENNQRRQLRGERLNFPHLPGLPSTPAAEFQLHIFFDIRILGQDTPVLNPQDSGISVRIVPRNISHFALDGSEHLQGNLKLIHHLVMDIFPRYFAYPVPGRTSFSRKPEEGLVESDIDILGEALRDAPCLAKRGATLESESLGTSQLEKGLDDMADPPVFLSRLGADIHVFLYSFE